jgi:hypothetical protein
MQIDFHHGVTYVAARLAGFPHEDAEIIAYAAQYVDDATCAGAVQFDNKAIYKRISSSHKTIDFKNFDPLEDLLVWMPFHFLPGNGGVDPGDNPDGTFIHKLVALPDSPVAQEMVRTAIIDHDKPYSLHRLGITMHVYADTWAHQGFAGVLHEINEVDDFDEIGNSAVFEWGLKGFINRVLEKAVPPLGHGKANVFPDMPFLSWRYRDGHGKVIERDNTDIFCKAADALCRAMQEYRRHTTPTVQVSGIGDEDMKKIRALFLDQRYEDGRRRHRAWLRAISGADGNGFSFGPASISYAEDGENSWKAQALGDSEDHDERHEYPYSDAFLTSNWKLFHDALQLHRITVSHDILPKYGICAA